MRHLIHCRMFATVVLAVCSMGSLRCARAELQSPALDAYQQVGSLRDKHADVIWNKKPASPEELHAILSDLDAGLSQLATPLNTDLAAGNLYLRLRRVNFLIDKIIVLDLLHEEPAAIRTWLELEQITWMDLTRPEHAGGQLRHLLERPEAAGILAQLQAASHLTESASLASPYRPNLSVEERVAGLSRIWSLARDGFVWFDHVPSLDWDRAYLNTLPKVMAAQDTESYYRELMRFVALLQDGHSNALPPESIAERFYSRPGLRSAMIDGHVLVTTITDADLPRTGLRIGDEIISIDGLDVQRYANEQVDPYVSSSTGQDRIVRVYRYGLLAGPAERAVHLGLRAASGRQFSVVAPRSGYRQVKLADSSFTLRNDGIAVIVAKEFEDGAAAEVFAAHRKEIMPAKGLILDLRGNGGGSSTEGFALLSWLTETTLPSMVSTYRDGNALDQADLGKSALLNWHAVNDEPYSVQHPAAFRGPVAMLIDAATFSAAEDTAAVFKLMHRGIIVGVPSGGSSGQPLFFELPGGGHARICVKRDSYPDGSSFIGVGVQPDVESSLTIKDVREGRDGVLERAVKALAASGRT